MFGEDVNDGCVVHCVLRAVQTLRSSRKLRKISGEFTQGALPVHLG